MCCLFFFFKQKTAYEMRISDWSSDVCSSDLNKEGEEVVADAEPRTIQTPFGDRSGVVIEPWLTDQWYVDAEKLAFAPMQAVRDGRIEIVPKTWEKTFFNWMENIQPWCVSRQLWWGHRIPAWFGPHTNNGAIVPSLGTHKIGRAHV